MKNYEEYLKQGEILTNNFLSTSNISNFKKLLNNKIKINKLNNRILLFKTEFNSNFNETNNKTISTKKKTFSNKNNFYSKIFNNKSYDYNNDNFFLKLNENKNKNLLQGNFKWGKMKFEIIKRNLAQRKNIPYKNFQFPKYNNDDNNNFLKSKTNLLKNNNNNNNINLNLFTNNLIKYKLLANNKNNNFNYNNNYKNYINNNNINNTNYNNYNNNTNYNNYNNNSINNNLPFVNNNKFRSIEIQTEFDNF